MRNKGYFFLAILSVCIASGSQILLKISSSKKYSSKLREYVNLYVITGYGMLFFSMVLTLVAYRKLSYLSVPVVETLGYILVPVLSALIFKEKLTGIKRLGIFCILAGMILYYI